MAVTYDFDLAHFDFAVVHNWLTNSYWSPGISRERVEQGFRNSALCVGAFCEGQQVGVARVVSDTTRFAYIADVFVAEGYRGRGVGRELVRQLMNHAALREVSMWCLMTFDAQGVYETLGFERTRFPERCMICYDKSKAQK